MATHIKIINPEVNKRWDEFVFKHPNGSIYHHSAWGRIIKSTYNHAPFYLAFENPKTGEFEGIIPFFLIDSWVTGKRLVSLPFSSYCPALISSDKIENVLSFVNKKYPDLDYMEIKQIGSNSIFPSENFKTLSSHVTHLLNLEAPLYDIFNSFHKNSVQQSIKRAKRENLKFRLGESEEDLEKFFELETIVRKKHGLPPAPYSFFYNMWSLLKKNNFIDLPIIEYMGKIIAGAIILKYKDVYHFEYNASDQNYLNLCPNHMLIWEVIKLAHIKRLKYFDFGRSSLSHLSLIKFKERWGTQSYKFFYYYYPNVKGIDTENGKKRQMLGFINRHLPNPLLQLEGKLLYPHLG